MRLAAADSDLVAKATVEAVEVVAEVVAAGEALSQAGGQSQLTR